MKKVHVLPKEEAKQDFYKIGDFDKNCDDGCKYHCTKGNTQLAECLKEQNKMEETAKEKAEDLYTEFQVFYWDEVDGYMPDDFNTKRIVCKLIDEIKYELMPFDKERRNWWKEVKNQVNKL